MILSLSAETSQMTGSIITDHGANYGNKTSKKQEPIMKGKKHENGKEKKDENITTRRINTSLVAETNVEEHSVRSF